MTERLRVHVDSTVLNTMDLCPERWRLEYYENWRPQKKAIALERGILMHQMLEHFHREKMGDVEKGKAPRSKPSDMPNLVEECLMIGRIYASNSAHIDADEFQEDMRVFKEYFQRWQYDGWEILAVELPFSIPIFDSPKLLIQYDGIIDLIVRDPKLGIAIVDNKTESRESHPFILSNQFEGYQWASKDLLGLENPAPLIVNKIGYQHGAKMGEEGSGPDKKRVDMRFRRIVMQSGPEALAEWREDTIKKVIESIGWIKDLSAGKRLTKNRTSCDKWAGCIYQRVCKEPSDVREHKLTVDFFRDKPWDVHERDKVVDRDETEVDSVRNRLIHDEATTF